MIAQWVLGRPAIYGIPTSLPFLELGETIYEDPWPPRSISAASAGAVAQTMPLADRELPVRRSNAARLSVAVRSSPGLQLIESSPPGEPGYLRLPLIARGTIRNSLVDASARRLGVLPSYPRAIFQLDQFQRCWNNRGGRIKGAAQLAEQLVTLPTHGLLTERDLRCLEKLLV
jgi:hypothetical protein